jgi:hypothetical protein
LPRAALLAIFLLAAPSVSVAAQSPAAATAAICDASAAAGAASGAAAGGPPVEILRALTRTETGRRLEGALRPWPWTVNMEGEGFWFDNREEALAFVRARHAAGARSFDIGCFQINFRWHGEAFESFEEMFDPAANAAYAVRFLTELKAEGGDWRVAVGKYHSRTPEFAGRYTKRFDSILASLDPAEDLPALAAPRILLAAAGEGAASPGGLFIAGPAHAAPDLARSNWRGGVALSALSAGAPLLRAGRPLFD